MLTTRLADLHFAPTAHRARPPAGRGRAGRTTFILTGNTVIDALLATVRPDYRFTTPGARGARPALAGWCW